MSKQRVFVGDFETTVYKGQEYTEVWASASVELGTEDVKIFHSIDEQFNYFISLNESIIVYYHNLKFDGEFWLSYLLTKLEYKQALFKHGDKLTDVVWLKNKEMNNNTFKYVISDMGQWYSLTIKVNNHIIELRDSLKLLPFPLRVIGDSFKTKHRKLDMEYTGFRYAGCNITEEEKQYIANDVLVIKEALEIMFEQGHSKLTIGACCLSEYKTLISKDEYNLLFPSLSDIPLNKDEYGAINVDEYIRKSYKGGWCYLVKGAENKIYNNGITADVNSLYPSVMSSESGSEYPVGVPQFWKGDYIPEEAFKEHRYFFIRIKTRFYLKENMLPFIQIKRNPLYRGTEMLESSDIYNYKTKTYSRFYYDENGEVVPARVELTLTCIDYKLFLEHYNVEEFEILDGCIFFARAGIFDTYIEKYKHQKLVSKGALRQLAKLFLNNLYGKLATNDNSSFKVARVKEDKSIGFIPVSQHDKKTGYIACGSAITSYAREFTIRTAQKNYYGVGKRGFKYADTDSIHCDLSPEELKGVKVHDKNFCCWKLESSWDNAIFVRQKTYIEHVVAEDLKPIEEPYYNIKCAGMPDKCKNLFERSMNKLDKEQLKLEYETGKLTEDEYEFLQTKRTLKDFTIGLNVPGKLLAKKIRGGVILVDTPFEMRYKK